MWLLSRHQVSSLCLCLCAAWLWRFLKGTAPLTAWPHCSCSGLCAGVSPRQRAAVDGRSREEERRSGQTEKLRLSHLLTPEPGRRTSFCLAASGRRAALCRLHLLYFIPGITVFDGEEGSSGHGRVFTSEPWPAREELILLDLSEDAFLCFLGGLIGFECAKIIFFFFTWKFHAFVLSRSCLRTAPHRTAGHVLTARNYCFPASSPQASQAQVGYLRACWWLHTSSQSEKKNSLCSSETRTRRVPSWMMSGGSICAPGPGRPGGAPGTRWERTWECLWCCTSCSTRKAPPCPSPAIRAVILGSAWTGPACVTTDGSGISASTVRGDSSKFKMLLSAPLRPRLTSGVWTSAAL